MSDPREPGSRASLEFVGTATCLLRMGPFTVLTDPNFLHRGQRAYLGRGLWSRRLTEPSLQPDQLPGLDLVVLSHLHGDHFDRIARRGLDRDLPVLTTEPAARRLGRWGFAHAEALRTWSSETIVRDGWTLQVTAAPGVHAPGPVRALLPTVMGSVFELTGPDPSEQAPTRVYVTGDTLCRPWLREVVERTGPLDATVLHLGGTRILGLTVTMDDQQGNDLLDLVDPRIAVPVHHDDYGVFRSPLSDFLAETERRGHGDRVRRVERGGTVSLC